MRDIAGSSESEVSKEVKKTFIGEFTAKKYLLSLLN